MRVLAFGRLSDLPLDGVVIPAEIRDLEELRRLLGQRWPELNAPSVRVVVNQALVHENIAISPADEIAFLPPMSGG
jgi:molybdopterin synthase sulfur carrier subunit